VLNTVACLKLCELKVWFMGKTWPKISTEISNHGKVSEALTAWLASTTESHINDKDRRDGLFQSHHLLLEVCKIAESLRTGFVRTASSSGSWQECC